MPEPGPIEVAEKTPQPSGKRVIGVNNPEEMSRDEFSNSSELLFHGSRKSFNYNPKFAYDTDFYTTQDGSLTLGTGFYATPDRQQAENYSFVRQSGTERRPLNVISLLPKKAIMLDLRQSDDLEENSSLPKELFERWREKFVRHYKDQDRAKLPWYENAFETKYLQHLDKLAKYPDIDLRSMLWTCPDKRAADGFYPSPPWMDLFAQFMRDEGYDGVIYIEGGEGAKGGSSPTFCFYNIEKIGTYESWHQKAI